MQEHENPLNTALAKKEASLKYLVATIACLFIIAAFVLLAVAMGWKNGGGFLVQGALWSTIFVVWRSLTMNWHAILSRIRKPPNCSAPPIVSFSAIPTISAGVLIILSVAIIGVLRSCQSPSEEGKPTHTSERDVTNGNLPYTPSRLVWLAVDLNAALRTDISSDHPFTVSFIGLPKTDTIVIYIVRMPNMTQVDQEVLEIELQAVKEVIAIKANGLGWSSWLKVEERYPQLPIGSAGT